jgi:hypothetical protein
MPTCKKTWKEKIAVEKSPKRVVLDKDFAGIPKGTMLFVGTPKIIDQYIRKIPNGRMQTMHSLRRDLAKQHDCEATCPVSTAIFVRMSAEAAWDDIQAGVALDKVAPFWRVVEPDSTIAKKLRVDSAWIAHQREMELESKTTAKKTSRAMHESKLRTAR